MQYSIKSVEIRIWGECMFVCARIYTFHYFIEVLYNKNIISEEW